MVYGPGRSPFVEKVGLGLAFKGFEWELVEPTGPEDFRRWSPETGMLPAMDFDGTRVADSMAILDWLEERHPDPPLQARDPWTARSQRMLESWIGETFYFYWVRWVRERVQAGEMGTLAGEASGGALARLGVLGRIGQLLDTPQVRVIGLGPEFQRRLDDLAGFLANRPFFYADRIGRADLTAAAFLRSLESGVIPDGQALLSTRPSLVALMERVRAATEG